MLHVASCMLHVASCKLHRALHRACCMLHRAWQLVGSRSVGCTCAGLGSASEDEARRGRAWRGKSQGAARPLGCAGEVSAHEGRPSMHMPAALPIGIPPACARSIPRGARGQSALSCLNSAVGVKGGEGGAGSNPEGGQTGKEGAQYNPFHSEAGRAMSFGRRLSESEDPDDRPRSHELTSRVARRGEAHRLRPQGSAR